MIHRRLLPAIVGAGALAAAASAVGAAECGSSCVPAAKRISAAGHEVTDYTLAGNAGGDFAAVWSTYAPRGHTRIFERDRPAGGDWGQRQDFSRLRADAGGTSVAVAPDGTVTVGWTEEAPDGTTRLMAASRRPGAKSFGAGSRIAPHAPWPGGLELTAAPDGRVLAAWVEFFHRRPRIRAAVRRRNGRWGRPEVVTTGNRYPDNLQLAFDAAGNATLVWDLPEPPDEILARHVGHNPEPEVRTAVRPAGGSFAPSRALSRPTHDAQDAVFAENGDGDAIVLWTSYGPRRSHFEFARYGPNRIGYTLRRGAGEFGRAHWLTRKSENASSPKATIDPGANVLVFWDRPVTKRDTRTVLSRRPAGGEFGRARAVSPRGVTGSFVAGNRAGDALAVWERENRHFDGYVQGRFVAADGSLGQRRSFSRTGALNLDPSAVLADGGRALVGWTRVAHPGTVRATDVLEVARVRVGLSGPGPER
jgi:hypothetical protein